LTAPQPRHREAPARTPRRFTSPQDALTDALRVVRTAPDLWRAYRGQLTPARREAVMVAVSKVNACAGCTWVHQRWALHAGISPTDLDAIGAGDLTAVDPVTRAAVVYATERAERGFRSPVDPDVAAIALARLGRPQLRQVDAVARLMTFANLTLNTLQAARPARAARAGRSHPVFARLWRLAAPKVMTADQRRELLAGLSGSVVEVGAGDGRNFAHYPDSVTRVWALEPEHHLRERAHRTAAGVPVPITVIDAAGEGIPAPDGTFDAAVCCLVLCSVTDQAAVLGELRRVLRPDGQIRIYEHVVAHDHRRTAQRLLDASGVWPALGAGCHLARDTERAIIDAGFELAVRRQHDTGAGRFTIPHIFGVAHSPRATP
jgi:AhpD family alkylhydroperoxidase